jgi:hypothetical protein
MFAALSVNALLAAFGFTHVPFKGFAPEAVVSGLIALLAIAASLWKADDEKPSPTFAYESGWAVSSEGLRGKVW